MITECVTNRLKPLYNRLQNKLGPDNDPYLDQIITPETTKLGPDNDFTAYAYTYIYIERDRQIDSSIYIYVYMYMANASTCAALFQYIQVKRHF